MRSTSAGSRWRRNLNLNRWQLSKDNNLKLYLNCNEQDLFCSHFISDVKESDSFPWTGSKKTIHWFLMSSHSDVTRHFSNISVSCYIIQIEYFLSTHIETFESPVWMHIAFCFSFTWVISVCGHRFICRSFMTDTTDQYGVSYILDKVL